MLLRKNICIRYIPKDNSDIEAIILGVFVCCIHEKRINAPNVAQSTLGVQNSQAHSRVGVSIVMPGTPLYQNDHPVKAEPINKHGIPIIIRFWKFQFR